MSPQVKALLAEINDHGNAFLSQEYGARRKLLSSAVSLIAELEIPVETIKRITWAEPATYVALRTAIDLKLFEKLVEPDESPKSITELAKVTGANPDLLARILKHLGAMNVLNEPEPGVFSTTELAKALVIPEYRDSICAPFDLTGPPLSKLPAYLAKTDYMNPTDPTDGPFQYGHGIKESMYDYIGTKSGLRESFDNFMAGHRKGHPNWMDEDFFPVRDSLRGIELHDQSPLLVDVGGGLGHDAMEFRSKHPDLPGRIIVQDLPATIQGVASNNQDIEFMAHDFRTPQPIQGACFYYLHYVLHDWTDDKCQVILGELTKAMKRGYSKLLIQENVVPDQHAPGPMTGLDIMLMALAATSERSEKQWRELLSSNGLKVIKIWGHPEGTESLIETELC
ncbi:MAG: hypothetical protein Q9182_002166 [Xanthomendoza sp. 2 TL-2023]